MRLVSGDDVAYIVYIMSWCHQVADACTRSMYVCRAVILLKSTMDW